VLPTVPAQQREIWQRTAGLWAVARLPELVPVFEQGADALLPLAFFALDRPEASFWQEAWAGLLAARGELNAALEVQLAAAANAQGARRAVLLRRIADAQLFAGQPEKTLATLSTIGRASLAASPVPTGPVARVLAAQARPLLDRWESLSSDEALAMVDLTRAEALSHLVKKDDTTKAFGDLEKRLEKLSGDVAAQLWARWARSQAWFLCEILGKAAVALKACQKVRTRVPAELLAKDPDLLGFVRAEEIACSGLGDFTRALQLAEEMTALAGARNDVRGQCLAWNARAILHLGQGEPGPSRKGFERSLELARATGWRRREAITTHNLALVLLELGDWDRAQAYEERYAALSITIGNHAASAEAPAVLAGVALARGDLSKAELLITQTRKAAESNEWGMLLAWSRALAGKLRLQRYAQARDSIELSKARNDLLAAIDLFEESSTSWTEEVDPAEVYALHAAALKLGGNASGARDALARAQKHVPAQNVVSVRALAVGAAFVEGGGIEPALEWFVTRGYQRLTGLWRQLTM
jgi:tetratricopeptide (TPR) repeat protein